MEKMTITEVLSESAMITMSLENLDMCYNEGVAGNVISAVTRLIDKFVTWIKTTVWPMLKKIGEFIKNALNKTKLGRKVVDKFDRKKPAEQEVQPEMKPEVKQDEKPVEGAKFDVMKYPKWLNYIVHSIIVPNRVMKLVNNTEDKGTEIQQLGKEVDKHIADGKLTVQTESREEVDKQLRIILASIQSMEKTTKEISDRCEEMKRKIAGKVDAGSANIAKNVSNTIQIIMGGTARAMNQALQISDRLSKNLQ